MTTNAAHAGAALPNDTKAQDDVGFCSVRRAVPATDFSSRPPCAPWTTADLIERGKQLRSMATAAYMLLGPRHDLWRVLRAAETDAEALLEGHRLVEALPSLTRRRLLSTFAAITWPRAPSSRSRRRGAP